jgi:D-alanyl-D-alanine carboxypeptidase/D-alanyl-D-alanine-endopeptidase (penicillin-binding protein 4)
MKRLLSFLFVALFLTQTSAQTPIEKFLNHNLIRNANVSVLVRDLDTGKTIAERNSTVSIIPASTIKLITSATAFELLGADYRFETRLQIDGTIDDNGVLHGNLIIFGGGDPTLGSASVPSQNREFLTRWSREIRRVGIRSINGRIIGDASLFDDEGVNPQWTWEDMSNHYAPGAYGISYMDNAVRVHFNSGAIGTTPTVTRIVPDIPGFVFQNHLRSTGIGRDSAYFYGAPLSNMRTIVGEIPANNPNFTSRMEIPDPALLLAQHLHNRLVADGISIVSQPIGIYRPMENNSERKTIFTHQSLPFSWIAKEINFRSNNHYSEHVFRYLALQQSQTATTNGAIRVTRNHWRQRGLPVDQLFLFDGSGLARPNGVSAEFFVRLLAYMNNRSSVGDDFFESLPIGGESGTIAGIFKNETLKGNIRAKSGSLSRVRAYAGYLEVEGKNYAFAILLNNFNGRAAPIVREIENFLTEIVE